MSKFKIGQQIVCIHKYGWYDPKDQSIMIGPKFNDVCIVDGYSDPCGCFEMISLKEWPDDKFAEVGFRPLAEITEIHELLSAVPQTTTV